MARIWAYTRPYRRAVAVSALLFPALAVVDLVQPYLVKIAIDDYILRGDWPGLSGIALALLGALVAEYGLRYLQLYLVNWTGQHVVRDLRAALFTHVQRLPARFFDRHPVGRLMTRVLSDVEAVGELFASGVVSIFGDVITLAGVVVVMLWLDWRLALVSFAAVPVLFAVALGFRRRARDAYREVRNRLAHLNGMLQESVSGMSVIQLFGHERATADEFRELSQAYRRAGYRRMRYDALLYAGVELVGSIALAALVFWGGSAILAGTVSFGVLVAFIAYTQRFFLPIRDLSAKYAVMQSAMVGAERIFGLLDTPVEIESPANGHPGPAGPAFRGMAGVGAAPAVEFRDVWFAYDSVGGGAAREPEWVLRGVSFRIAPGERVGIVGPTGAGKTTVARLMNRSYDAQQGAVLVEGVDVREWDLRALRQRVGVVLQDVVVFTGSVEANLTLGQPGVSRDLAVTAARRVGADRFIRALPGGYGEEIRERGGNLSHGERQLLSVARALVYDSPVLVLDEATSSVDPATERLLRDAIDTLLEGRTSIVIAHRFSTIEHVDRVLVFQQGRLVEEGTPAALVRQGGVYSALYELQRGAEAAANPAAGDR
jgi:ATP-binding cassette subfamily B protein